MGKVLHWHKTTINMVYYGKNGSLGKRNISKNSKFNIVLNETHSV